MARSKRHYVPKVRGCYECSQRRIHCDRSEPKCTKCTIRGIDCSGLGIRYRFSSHVPQNCRAIASRSASTASSQDSVMPKSLHNAVCVIRTHQGLREKNVNSITCSDAYSSMIYHLPDPVEAESDRVIDEETLSVDNQGSSDFTNIDTLNIMRTGPDNALIAWKRYLLSYFSRSIAPEMVVVDDKYNGWRSLVLNIAHLDDLVMDAALSAAAFHFTSTFGSHIYNSHAIYANAIRRLRRRQDLAMQDVLGKQGVLLALVVLLATVMVNGFSDFSTIFDLLESAVEAVGGEEQIMQGELGYFVVRQIRKYRGYAAPFLDRTKGLARLSLSTTTSSHTVNGWECFRHSYHIHPELSDPLSMVHRLNQLSCDIYVARVIAGPSGPPLTHLLEEYVTILDLLQPGHAGEHTLVWATFLVAAESTTPMHRERLGNALLQHYQRNGFKNIALALDHLRKIWEGRDRVIGNGGVLSNQTQQDWTTVLPTLKLFIV